MPNTPESHSANFENSYLALFDEQQSDRAQSQFSGESQTRLNAFVEKLKDSDVELSLFSDFLFQQVDLIKGVDGEVFCEQLAGLVTTVRGVSEIHLPRLLQTLTRHCEIDSIDQLRAARDIARQGIYPGRTMIDHCVSLPETLRENWFDKLRYTIASIRESEQFNEKDPIELELFYTYLNVDISFGQFSRAMELVSASPIEPIPPRFQPFRISARGVEALTHDIDSDVVAQIQQKLLVASSLQTAKDEIAQIPHMPGKVLPPDLKVELMIGCVITIAEALSAKQKVKSIFESNPFTKSNVLGTVESLVASAPSYEKSALLWSAQKTLHGFIAETEELLKEGDFKLKQQLVLRGNIEKAKTLGALCARTFTAEIPDIIASLPDDNSATRSINGLCEILMDVSLLNDRTPEEDQLTKELAQSLCMACFAHLPKISSEVVHDLLREKAVFLQKSSIDGQTGAPSELWSTLKVLALQEASEMSEEIRIGTPELVLENARELYQERIPEVLKSVLESNDRCYTVGQSLHAGIREVGSSLADELIGAVEKAVSGAQNFIAHKGQSQSLKDSFDVFVRSVNKKIAEVRSKIDDPPAHIPRYYLPELVKSLAGSCRHHTTKNRTIARMLDDDSIDDSERKMLETIKSRMGQFALALDVLEESIQGSEKIWKTVYDEEGFDGLVLTLDDISQSIQAKSLKRFPRYDQYLNKRRELQEEQLSKRNETRETILESYTAEVADSGSDFDVAELNSRTRDAVKVLDKSNSTALKALRLAFEQDSADDARAVQVYEKFHKGVAKLAERLAPISKDQKDKLRPVLAQLGKITYRDLEEGEFELVPSKTKGDAIKAWVSNDCGKGENQIRHVLNRNFTNYRVYQNKDGEKLWCGNVYVLDANLNGEPQILFDAIQVSRSTSVNPRMFIQGVVEGFAKMGMNFDYQHIVSNVIHSTNEGYLVSNRPQLREAYIRLYGNGDLLSSDQFGDVVIDDDINGSFQCFNQGNGDFQVLWQHPNVGAAVGLEQVNQLITPLISSDLAQRLAARAQTDSFSFKVRFQSQEGYQKLEELAESPERLSLYLDLAERNIRNRAAVLVLQDDDNFGIIEKFHTISPKISSAALHALSFEPEIERDEFVDLAEYLTRAPECASYVAELFKLNVIPSIEEVEATLPTYQRLVSVGLANEYLSARSSENRNIAHHLKKLDELIDEGILSRENHRLAAQIFVHMPFIQDLNLRELTLSLKELDSLNDTAESVAQILSSELVLSSIRYSRLTSAEQVQGIVSAFRGIEDPNELLFKLRYAREALIAKLIPNLPADQLLTLMWRVKNHCKGNELDINPVLTSDVHTGLLSDQWDLNSFERLFDEIEKAEDSDHRSSLTRSMLVTRASSTPAFLISGAPEDELEDRVFYLTHIAEGALDPTDNLETLDSKFMDQCFDQQGLSSQPEMRHVVKCGLGYLFVGEDHVDTLSQYFDIEKLPDHKKTVVVDPTKKTKKNKDDDGDTQDEEQQPYSSVRNLLKGQPRIYAHPFHS